MKELYRGASVLLYWSYIFALSKYAELLDTLFLILRNPDRPVMFLHWYSCVLLIDRYVYLTAQTTHV